MLNVHDPPLDHSYNCYMWRRHEDCIENLTQPENQARVENVGKHDSFVMSMIRMNSQTQEET